MKKINNILLLSVVFVLAFSAFTFADEMDKEEILLTLEEEEEIGSQIRAVAQQVEWQDQLTFRGPWSICGEYISTRTVYKNLYPPTGYHYEKSPNVGTYKTGWPVDKGIYWERIDIFQFEYILVND